MTSILNYMKQVEDRAEDNNDEAFKLGATEVYDSTVIFVDVEALNDDNYIENTALLKEQLDSQVPGAFDALVNKLLNKVREERPELTRDELLSEEIIDPSSLSIPFTISNLMVEGQEYCIILEPNDTTDTKPELINRFTGQYSAEIREKIISHMPGDDKDWNRIVGNHEGGHCNYVSIALNAVGDQAQELLADRVSIKQATDRNQDYMALAWKDLRHLDASNRSQHHATGALLNSGDDSSIFHIQEAKTYKATMHEIVNDNFDWDTYEGKATTAKELMEENPDSYFHTISIAIDALKTNVMDAYNEKLTDDNIGDVISAQIRINYIENFEDAYRRRAMGQEIPEREPTQLIPQELEDAYLKKYGNVVTGDDISYQQGIDGTPYTTQVSGLKQGEPTVDFENGVIVNNATIPEIFAQSADPALENIKLVNARMLLPEDQIIPPIPVANNPEYDTQNLGRVDN